MVSKPNKQMTDTDHLIALRAAHIELKRDYAAIEKRCEEAERERDKVRNIVKFLEERLRHYYKVMEKRYNRIEDLESENALLRKRMEPIEEVYANWYELDGEEPSVQICKDLMEAIKKCVELREAE